MDSINMGASGRFKVGYMSIVGVSQIFQATH